MSFQSKKSFHSENPKQIQDSYRFEKRIVYVCVVTHAGKNEIHWRKQQAEREGEALTQPKKCRCMAWAEAEAVSCLVRVLPEKSMMLWTIKQHLIYFWKNVTLDSHRWMSFLNLLFGITYTPRSLLDCIHVKSDICLILLYWQCFENFVCFFFFFLNVYQQLKLN